MWGGGGATHSRFSVPYSFESRVPVYMVLSSYFSAEACSGSASAAGANFSSVPIVTDSYLRTGYRRVHRGGGRGG